MRRFHSYGPVDRELHFCIPRTDLVDQCLNQLIGHPEKGGHYFTIWAPRQTGKTWLMQQVSDRIISEYLDQYAIGMMSMQGLSFITENPDIEFLSKIPKLFLDSFSMDIAAPDTYEAWTGLFHRTKGLFQKPLILFIDEFDSLPPGVIDRLVSLFRDIYLNRKHYRIHALALIGVRAVLGLDSERGSPFNIQRSLHVPNFTLAEVTDLFDQYSRESGQTVDPTVVENLFEATNGQPGLVGWFGELLTEKYNPEPLVPIDVSTWNTVFRKSLFVEWNNTILNLIKKVQSGYVLHVLKLFSSSDVPFSLDAQWCSFLYLNGVIVPATSIDQENNSVEVCRFSCSFIQKRLYNALTDDLIGDGLPILAVEPLDDLEDVFAEESLNLPSLLNRYKAYLVRMKARGLNPFKDQPRRADLHFTEAVGHFHLYAWLHAAIGRRCVTSPEFPTGNGKVDIHIRCREKKGIIEIKSFVDMSETRKAIQQAAAYAGSLGLCSVTLALFVPVEDETVLAKLSGNTEVDGISVAVVAIGWT